jgi:hypothetical protein
MFNVITHAASLFLSESSRALGTRLASVGPQMLITILDLSVVKQIAEDVVARMEDPSLEVIGANVTMGGSAYVELTIAIRGRGGEPTRFVVSADRGGGEQALRSGIATRLREQLGRTTAHN